MGCEVVVVGRVLCTCHVLQPNQLYEKLVYSHTVNGTSGDLCLTSLHVHVKVGPECPKS